MAAAGDGGGNESPEVAGGGKGSAGKQYLVGGRGVDFVREVLSGERPIPAIQKIHQTLGLPPRCEALVDLMSLLLSEGGLDSAGGNQANSSKGGTPLASTPNATRPLVYLSLVNIGIEKLITHVPTMDSTQLRNLLDASFEYIDTPELRSVPLEILKHLKTIPSEFLKRLVSNPDLMGFLPINVQHQVWELDVHLFRRHILPLMRKYESELEGGFDFRPAQIKSDSVLLQEVMHCVGRSGRLYLNLVQLCRSQFIESGSSAACALRAEIVMALHTNNHTHEVVAADKIHRLAWTLAACQKAGGGPDSKPDKKRIKEVQAYFENLRSHANPQSGYGSDGGGSTTDDAGLTMGDAAMVVRSPLTHRWLFREVIRSLQSAIKRQKLPGDDELIPFLVQLCQLGLNAKKIVKVGRGSFPKPSRSVIRKLLPALGFMICESQLSKSQLSKTSIAPADWTGICEALGETSKESECCRKLLLTFLIVRAQQSDSVSVLGVLNALAAGSESTGCPCGAKDLGQLIELGEEITKHSLTNHVKLAFFEVIIMPLAENGLARASILGLKILSSDGDKLLGWSAEEASAVIGRLLQPIIMTSNENEGNQVIQGLSRLPAGDQKALIAAAKSLIKSTKGLVNREEFPDLFEIVDAPR